MRPRISTPWEELKVQLEDVFRISYGDIQKFNVVSNQDYLKAYEMMLLCRNFENACSQAYMQGHIRGFMHLDNGQETIPAFLADTIQTADIKYSYYREHAHALACNVSPHAIMAELFGRVDGTCRGAGGSMHIFDRTFNFQGGWALVAEQLPYAVGAARSILLDRLRLKETMQNDSRIAVVLVGEGGAQNGRMAECLNAAAKENLPLLFVIIDNGRAINTFTSDVAQNSNVFMQGQHYNIPGIKVDGQSLPDVLRIGRAVVDYVRKKGPAILQFHTYRLNGHSPADPEHERGRKDEKRWARLEADPIKLFENFSVSNNILSPDEISTAQLKCMDTVKQSVKFAAASPPPPGSLAKELEYPDIPETDYNIRMPQSIQQPDIFQREALESHMQLLYNLAKLESITIGDAVNLAIIEEMLRDPTVVIHAEDLQAGSSYNIPKLTQQTFGKLRAADEIIDEGHFIGKALGEALNGYRPIVELMNTNFGIYGIAEISSAGNTYATTGGQYQMPLTIIGAGGTAPSQALGAEHSQPLHAYIMGIPGLKICSASSPSAAYGLTKSMIRDNGPGILFLPVKMMKDVKSGLQVGKCLPLNRAALLHSASTSSIMSGKAITILTYLHGVKESLLAIDVLKQQDPSIGIDLIELRSLKPLDMVTIKESLQRTHNAIILDESTTTGGVGASISSMIHENCYMDLDGPVIRLSMDDAPVPYASSMEETVVKRCSDLVERVTKLLSR